MSFASVLIEDLRKLAYDPQLEGNPTLIAAGLKAGALAVRKIGAALKDASSTGQKSHLTTCLGQAKSLSSIIRALRITGAGYAPRKETATNRVKWEDLDSAFQGRVRTGVITNLKHVDPQAFFEDCSALFCRRIRNALKKHAQVKVNTVFGGLFEINTAAHSVRDVKYINTKNAEIFGTTDLASWFKENVEAALMTGLSEFQEKDSGFSLKAILNLQININKFTPQLGSSYIPLPKKIADKKACVNVKNYDDMCFVWAVTSALYPALTHSDRSASYPPPLHGTEFKRHSVPHDSAPSTSFRETEQRLHQYIHVKGKAGSRTDIFNIRRKG